MIGPGPELGLDLLGWSLALALGALAGWLWLRDARRRGALNRALHELRRPLQVLLLTATRPRPQPAPPPRPRPSGEPKGVSGALRLTDRAANVPPSLDVLEQALGAVADLDRAVNGSPAPGAARALCVQESVERVIVRWQDLLGTTELTFGWLTGEERVLADPVRFRQALENLIANAFEHGRPPIVVRAAALPSGVRLTVGDAGPALRLDPGAARNCRRGHGLAVAAHFAAAHGGALRSWHGADGGTVVAMDLPTAPRRHSQDSSPAAMGATSVEEREIHQPALAGHALANSRAP